MAEIGKVHHVKIKNMNPFPIRDAFDGVTYLFPPNHFVTVPMQVARHIFGFHLEATEVDVFNHITRRFGWNRPDMADQARTYFNNISIRPVIFRVVEQAVEDHKYAEPDEEVAKPVEMSDFSTRIDELPAKPGRPRKLAGDNG